MAIHPRVLDFFERSDVASYLRVPHQPVPNFPFLTVLLTSCLNSLRHIEQLPVMEVQEHWMHERGRFNHDDRSVADELAKRVRVLCMVMTQPSDYYKTARHVEATWGQRCNKLLFMSSTKNKILPAIKLRIYDNGSDFLWENTKQALRYIHQNYREDVDWFMRVDDNTYVVVENLRYMLSEYNSMDPISFGCRFKSLTPKGDMGGVGHVLSRGALDLLVEKGLFSHNLCQGGKSGAEEDTMDICLNEIGVRSMDSRDSLGRSRFLPFVPRDELFPNNDESSWNQKYNYYPTDEFLGSCSDHAISFYNVKPQDMYVIDYFVYRLRAYGIRSDLDTETGRNLGNLSEA